MDDGDDDDDLEMAETDLDAKEMEELNMEKRLRLATKKMEEMVKEQLRDSGVVPSGLKNNFNNLDKCSSGEFLACKAGLISGRKSRKSSKIPHGACVAAYPPRKYHRAYIVVSYVGYE